MVKGVSGNPKGRPRKEYCITSLAKALLEAEPAQAEQISRKWLEQARQGKTDARRDLQDRLEGRVPLPLEHTGELKHSIEFILGKGYTEANGKSGGK